MTTTASIPGLPPSVAVARDLTTLITMQGRVILDDRARLLLKLREAMPDRARAVNLLMTAFDAGAVHNLATSGIALDSLVMEQMAQSIVDSTGIQIDFARWALDAWRRTFQPEIVAPAVSVLDTGAAAIQTAPAVDAQDNMTWDDEPTPPDLIASPETSASSAGTAMPAPAAIVMTPPPARKSSILKWAAVLGTLLIAIAGGLYAIGLLQMPVSFFSSSDDEPSAPVAKKPVTLSNQILVAPGQAVTAAQVKEALTDVSIGGLANMKEPTFPSAYKADATQEHRQFEFNVKAESGKRFAYHVNLIGRNDTGLSQGIITAIDRSLSDDKMLSVSNPLKVENAPNKITMGHFAWGFTWARNPSNVPAICVQLYTTPDKPGETRYPAIFFVHAFKDGSCSPDLGTGTLQ